MHKGIGSLIAKLAPCVVLLLGVSLAAAPAVAASGTTGTIYVSTSGSDVSGTGTSAAPYATIGAALKVAGQGAVIIVEPGTYKESVTITSDVTLESDPSSGSASNTIIDASGQSNGIVITGSGAAGAVVKDLTVENAQKAGIVVENTSNITLEGNVVTANDQSCSGFSGCNNPKSNNGIPAGQPGSNVAAGGTAFTATNSVPCGGAQSGGSDCEALHLIGVTNSFVVGNTVENNLDGGIYLTDETGPTSGNLIADNTSKDNAVDCGITLAAHAPGHGIIDNLITGNTSDNPKGAAGVVIATAVPGAIITGNVVSDNTIKDNGSGGVVFHTHAPGSKVDDNVIEDNTISGNAADAESGVGQNEGIDILSASGSPVTGTVIEGNTITNETYGVLISSGTTGTVLPTSGAGANTITPSAGGTAIVASFPAAPDAVLGDLFAVKAGWPVGLAAAKALLPKLSADWFMAAGLQKPASALAAAVRAAYPTAGPAGGYTKAYLTAHGYLTAH